MMKTRRRFSADFKAKVALEAIRGERTISALGTKHVALTKPVNAEILARHQDWVDAQANLPTRARWFS